MARLEAQSKILYYPTPDQVVDLIATWFKPGENARLVDPCCGTGAALRRFSDQVRTDRLNNTWGIEISYSRAEEAIANLDLVLPVSFYDVAKSDTLWSRKSVSLAFNNPPYDWSDFLFKRPGKNALHLRHEVLFVELTTPKIVTGGHQVIIVPQPILGDPSLGTGLE
jgi:type I restriction-modification system DNA methylase subunit